jgi:four helix bundle protein
MKTNRLVEQLPGTGIYAAGQLLRSGMSPLSVHRASELAGSKAELISNLRACLRQLEEGRRWLRFIRHMPLIEPSGETETDLLLTETESLIRIFAARLWTARGKRVLRWRPRRPTPVIRSTPKNNLWTLAKEAWRHFWSDL